MAAPIFRLTAFVTIVALCGCSSPQISPPYYGPQPPGIPPDMAPPDSLDAAMVSVENLQRQYTWQAGTIDGTSANLSTFLIGLVSFGLYKGVTHPSANLTAGTGALGSSAYAYGTGNKLGDRGNAYADGYERLACSLIAAAPYRLTVPDANGASGASLPAQRLDALIASAEKARADIADQLITLAPYGVPQVLEQPKSARSQCSGLSGQLWRSAYERACKVPASAGKTLQPPPRLLAALDNAGDLSGKLDDQLKRVHAIKTASRQMGEHLWQNAKFIDNQVGRAVRGTIANPLDAVDRVKTYMARKDGVPAVEDPAPVDAQGKRAPPDPKAAIMVLDAHTEETLEKLERSNLRARASVAQLNDILAANPVPHPVSFNQIDSCRSPADQVAQGIAAATPAPASTPQKNKLSANRPLPDLLRNPQVLTGLDLSGKPTEAQLLARVKTCQTKLGQTPDGEVPPQLEAAIISGQCRGS